MGFRACPNVVLCRLERCDSTGGAMAGSASGRTDVGGRFGLEGMVAAIRPRRVERQGGLLPCFLLKEAAAHRARRIQCLIRDAGID